MRGALVYARAYVRIRCDDVMREKCPSTVELVHGTGEAQKIVVSTEMLKILQLPKDMSARNNLEMQCEKSVRELKYCWSLIVVMYCQHFNPFAHCWLIIGKVRNALHMVINILWHGFII